MGQIPKTAQSEGLHKFLRRAENYRISVDKRHSLLHS